VPVTIPQTGGRNETFWYLISDSDQIVGTNSQGEPYLWLKVEVQPASLLTPTLISTSSLETPTLTTFSTTEATVDLYNSACSATWLSNTNPIPCPEFETNPLGSVQLVKNIILESGNASSNSLLFSLPESQSEIVITGTYPAFTVQNGDRLTFRTGCLQNASQCSTLIYFYYINTSGAREILWAVSELQDGITSNVEIDLSFLQGQTINIQIEVSSLGESIDDVVLVDSPQILHADVSVIATETPTIAPTGTPTFTPSPTMTNTPVPTSTLAPTPTEEPQNFFEQLIQFFKDLFGFE
jgi:hypothetical protein